MTNSEAISLIEQLKAEIEWDLSLEYLTALDKAISSLELDEIGLTDTVKQIHDGVYAEAYEKGRADAIAEISREMRMLYGNEYEKKIREDAIDEFVEAIEKHQTRQDSYLDPPYVEMGLDMTDVIEVAEQLKEQK